MKKRHKKKEERIRPKDIREVEKEREKIKGEYKLYAIKEGVVIDHIPTRNGLKVVEVLGVNEDGDSIIGMGINFKSKKIGHKDVVKIENKVLTAEELNKISLFAPHATISRIKNYKVVEKSHVKVPSFFENIVHCNNPNCATRHWRMPSKFLTLAQDPLELKCFYCERTVGRENLKLL